MKVIRQTQRNIYSKINPSGINDKTAYVSSLLDGYYFRYKGALNNKYSSFNFYEFK